MRFFSNAIRHRISAKRSRRLPASETPNRRDYEVEWNFAKCSYFFGKQTKSPHESEKILEKGAEAGKLL